MHFSETQAEELRGKKDRLNDRVLTHIVTTDSYRKSKGINSYFLVLGCPDIVKQTHLCQLCRKTFVFEDKMVKY